MEPKLVQALAANTIRLRQLSVKLRETSMVRLRLSQDTRAEGRARVRRHMEDRVRRAQSLRERSISSRLLTRRLPRASASVLIGKPGAGDNCDGCDKPLTSAQLVMAIPFEKTFVHLHAGCFMIWNAIRPHTGEGKIA